MREFRIDKWKHQKESFSIVRFLILREYNIERWILIIDRTGTLIQNRKPTHTFIIVAIDKEYFRVVDDSL